jgi:ribosomal protein S18 acetylase RimI-like enzyme
MEMDRLSASVEEACLNAWPALKEIFYDGWLIRLAEGHTRRTNSVNVIGPGIYDLDDKIDHCENIYRAHRLPTYFRVRSSDYPALEQALISRGFRAEDETCTLYLDFADAPLAMPHNANIQIVEGPPSAEWLDAHERFSGRPVVNSNIHKRLLDLVALPVAFAAARNGEGQIVSVAYGAVHDRLVSLQWVATDPALRRKGFSRATLTGLLDWAHRAGAVGACLQVVADNTPAVNLYRTIGFTQELYRYHYRVL